MDIEKSSELLGSIMDTLTDEQKEKVKACKDDKELMDLLAREGVELPDEALNSISGGGCPDKRDKGYSVGEKGCAICGQRKAVKGGLCYTCYNNYGPGKHGKKI